jgi:hypothetical protein
MANLILTSACNMGCPFCFASESRTPESIRESSMSVTDFWTALEFSGRDNARFCGGEPTIHPDFTEMLSAALAPAAASALVMTNGQWPDQVLAHVRVMPVEDRARVSFLFNILAPGLYRAGGWDRLEAAVASPIPHKVTLGFTIYAPEFEFEHILELGLKHGIRRIRYSIAAPNLTDEKSHLLDPKKDFPLIAEGLVKFAKKATAAGFTIDNDCGYLPPCAFTPEDREFMRDIGALRDACPTSPVDVGTHGEAWRCYGLYSLMRANTKDFPNAKALGEHFDRRMSFLDSIPLFEECDGCEFMARGACGGGCHVYRAVWALREHPDMNLVPIDDDTALLACTPTRKPEASLAQSNDGGRRLVIGARTFEASANLVAFFDACDGATTLAAMAQKWGPNFDSAEAATTAVVAMAKALFERDAIKLALPRLAGAPEGIRGPS